MKKIIGLKGRGRCGKTATLNFLIDLLTVETTKCTMPTPHKGDRKKTFTYNSNIISICTGGDNADILKENIAYFKDTKCDIAISATRTSGGSYNKLEEFANENNLAVEWIQKSYDTTDFANKNMQTAQDIFNQL